MLRKLLTHHPLVNILFAVVLIFGVLSFLEMPRENDPDVNFNWIIINTVLPGASAKDVEDLVTSPLEDALTNVKDVKFVSSNSQQDSSSMLVRFEEMPRDEFLVRFADLRRDIQNKARAELPDEAEDPRLALTQQLLEDLTDQGTIFAFHQSFEIGVIKGLAKHIDQYAEPLKSLIGRFKDLEVPFNKLMYYHPDFHGSFSIKSVLPALFPNDPELDYKSLDIQSGDVAMNVFPRLQEVSDPDEKESIRKALLAYCRLDTLAMVKIWGKLRSL